MPGLSQRRHLATLGKCEQHEFCYPAGRWNHCTALNYSADVNHRKAARFAVVVNLCEAAAGRTKR